MSLKCLHSPKRRPTDQYNRICSLTVVARRRAVDCKQRQQHITGNSGHRDFFVRRKIHRLADDQGFNIVDFNAATVVCSPIFRLAPDCMLVAAAAAIALWVTSSSNNNNHGRSVREKDVESKEIAITSELRELK